MPALLPSELPIRAKVRNHWVTMLKPPHKVLAVALLVLLLAAIADPNPMAWLLGVIVLGIAFLRWQTWQAECVIITGKRIVRYDGVPETTSFEASLRLDRISGAVLVKTVPGKILGYGDIELEAPGDHPDVRKLRKIADADEFYLELRRAVFGEPPVAAPGPVDVPRGGQSQDYVTEELPPVPPRRDRFGRRLR